MTTEDLLADKQPPVAATAPCRFRRFQPSLDVERLARLFTAIEAVDHDDEHSDVEALRQQLAWPGHDPLLDRWVVEETENADALIGFASLWKAPASGHGDIVVRVHPAWRRKGIGSELLARMKARARELGAASLGAYINVNRPDADAFLRKRGFQPVSFYTRLRAPMERLRSVASEPVWPTGISARSYAEDNRLDALLTGFNTCFEGQPGHIHLSELELLAWLPQLDPHGIFLAYDEQNHVVGMIRAGSSKGFSVKYGAPVAYFDAPGAVPAYRSDPKTLYLPLLMSALRWALAPGALEQEPALAVMESWGDLPSTLALYQSLGFAIIVQEHSYRWDAA